MSNARSALLDQLAKYAYSYDPINKFKLASGVLSDEYLDCKMALSRPETMAVLGLVFREFLRDEVVAIGGLTMGSDPIAMSTCQASAGTAHAVRWFSVRKDAKEHGKKKIVEGSVSPGDTVAVVDDVVTSGQSTITAIERCREFGLKIAVVVVLVDREQSDGLENIRRAAQCDVLPVFTKTEIKKRWAELHQTPETLARTA
jgi:orotate phosphoribosyltransferase